MIKIPTTLILGAGASMQYGFPSGYKLTREVIEHLGRDSNTRDVETLQALGYSLDAVREFRNALLFSDKPSVDAFLEHRDTYLDIGKAAIACRLIPCEDKTRLFNVENSWYQHLSKALNCKQTEFADNTLSVVTFNYDRSLECYLHECLKHTYGLSEEGAAELLAHIPVVHVHGSLGRLPWESGDAKVRPYSAELTPASVAVARDSIRVIHEGGYDDPALRKARDVINAAEVVVFLGFGYHEPNVERLQIDFSRDRVYWGTACGLREAECNSIQRRLFGKRLHMGHRSWEILQFLREKVELV